MSDFEWLARSIGSGITLALIIACSVMIGFFGGMLIEAIMSYAITMMR